MPIKFRALKPDKYDVEAFTTASKRAADKVADGMLADFEKTTTTWEHKPRFEADSQLSGKDYTVVVGTDDEIYRYVDKGTRPHIIRPRRKRRLSFRTGYRAKTSPRQLRSGAGGAFGPRVSARLVHHPGTRAREFSDVIVDRWKSSSIRLIQEGISEAAKRLLRK